MDQGLFKKIYGQANKTDREDLDLVKNACQKTTDAYKEKPGKATKSDFDAARTLFDDTLDRLSAKYSQELEQEPETERFKNRRAALTWLRGEGYKISQGKFYQDCEAGFPQIHRDKTVSRFQVLQYGQKIDVQTRSLPENGGEDLKNRKMQLEIDRLEKENRKDDDRWLLKEDAWGALAAVVGTIQDSLKHHFNIGQGEIVHLAGGDQARGPEVFEGCEELIIKAFNEVCSPESISGVFETINKNEGG